MYKYNTAIECGIETVDTLVSGSKFVTLSPDALPCDDVVIYPPGSTSIDVKYSGQGDDKFVTITGLTTLNHFFTAGLANNISIRRTDLSNTPVTVRYVRNKYTR